MDSRLKRLTSATALFVALTTGLMYLPLSLAESAGSLSGSPQQASAILSTGNNQPITVNGASAISGATIMTGATIETPDQVGASVSIPGHFTLDIAAKASLSVEFGPNSIKVNLIKGCVVLHTKKGTTGEIDTSQGVVGRADGSKDARLDVCDPSLAAAPIPAAAAGGGLGSTGAIVMAAAADAGLIIWVISGGSNPSPHAP